MNKINEFLKTIKGLATLGILALVMGVFLGYCNSPTKETVRTVIQTDSSANAEQIDYWRDVAEHKQNLLEKALALNKVAKPSVVTLSAPLPSPLEKLLVLPPEKSSEGKTQDTCKQYAYPYDLPFFVKLDADNLTISTINNFIESKGGQYLKTYNFERRGERFSLATVPAYKQTDDGIKVVWNDPIFKWRGMSVGVASNISKSWYVYLNARLEIYDRVYLEPELRGDETPFYIRVGYRFLR